VKRERADVVVIGAGLAGASAAALLAARGHQVVVLERDQHAGGCAANFEKAGYRFAVGATVGMGLEEGGVLERIYRTLGLTPQATEVDPVIQVLVGDQVVELHRDRERWLREVTRAFPGQEARKRAFWSQVGRLARGLAHASKRFPVMPFSHPLDLLDTARGAHPSLIPVLFQLRRSVADLLRDHGVDDLAHRAFIDGQLIDAMQTDAEECAAPNGALALDVYRYGAQYVHGGLVRVAQDFLGVVRERGGRVVFGTRARSIASDGHQVLGVETRQGLIEAPVVISTVPMANTAALLGDPGTPLSERADRYALASGPFTLYLGVDERALPRDVHPYLQITDLPNRPGEATPVHDGGNLLISISPSFDRSRAPAGKRAITVSTHVDAAHWLQLGQDRDAYAAAKEAFTERLLGQLERWLPNLRGGLEVLEAGTPRTFYSYTRRHGGTAGGFAQSVGQANFAAPSHRTEFRGLFLAGDTIFPGPGALGVSISGFNAARSAHRLLASRRSPHRRRHASESLEVAA
jgi:C-3',4' desaturase CrtD